MEQLRDYADDRLFDGCVYCGGLADTVDHVPSRVFLDAPFPPNLPVVPACRACNSGFSRDEEYVACLLEAVVAGSADPARIRRRTVQRALRRGGKLRALIESGRGEEDGREVWTVDHQRLRNVILKLARGHVAYELSERRRSNPHHLAYKPLITMDAHERAAFEEPHFPEMWGEVGCRAMQRIAIVQVMLQAPDGTLSQVAVPMNDWVAVQDNRYRYFTLTTTSAITVRFVIGEYLACEVTWLDSDPLQSLDVVSALPPNEASDPSSDLAD